MSNSSNIDKKTILELLSSVVLPWKPDTFLTQTNLIDHISVQEDQVHMVLRVKDVSPSEMESLRSHLEHIIQKLDGVTRARVILEDTNTEQQTTGVRRLVFPPRQTSQPKKRSVPPHMHSVPEKKTTPQEAVQSIGCMIAIASGKGGVGKSSTTINLAVALARLGLRVGLLDADIHGPSIPHMLGLEGQVEVVNHKLIPMTAWGVHAMSIGMLVQKDQAMIWRGPMVMGAVKQLISDVLWGELDILLIDTPPGTGDIQLTLAQSILLDGAIIVSTPQDIALLDARRAISLFQKVKVPILGIIENMSYFRCPHCQEKTYIFGEGGAKQEAQKLDLPLLGEIPIFPSIRTGGDNGTPVAAMDTETEGMSVYYEIATSLIPTINRIRNLKTFSNTQKTESTNDT